MKYSYIYILLLIVFFSACKKGFLDQQPQVDLAEETSLRSETELELYLNNLYPSYIIGHKDSWADSRNYPFDITGSPILALDFFSDNLVMSGNAKSSLDNSFITPQDASRVGWNWNNLRAVNYFLTHYQQALPSVNGDQSALDKYVGEALFFKAWDYYNKVVLFGDVPWITRDLNTNSEELLAPRDPRVKVMDSVMSCINQAFDKLEDGGNPDGRINKDMAAFLKARIGLFEGSFRTYHKELGLEASAKPFLEACVEACEYLISGNHYQLYNGIKDSSYWKLFTFKNNPVADGNPEAILARTYDGSVVGHANQRYWDQNNNVSGRPAGGATKSLIDEYLCIDGKPIYSGGAPGNYVSNPLFKGYDGMWSELENRDPRLTQTICYPGHFRSIFNRGTGVWGKDENGTSYPIIAYSNGSSTVTGYWIVKHWMGDRLENEATTRGQQTAIVFRYAEVLLMLAEAKAILGTIDQSDLDNTINKLRERAGYDFIKYPDSKLQMGNIPADPRLDAIYAEKLDYPVSPLLREIRRERRVEMAVEGLRYEDLLRWKAGNLMTLPSRGMKFTAEKQNLYDGLHTSKPIIAPKAIVNTDVFLDDQGFIICYPRSPRITNGVLPWDDRRYYWPLPLTELTLNPNLTQNPGWQGAN